jgi:hypothetical protein
VCPYCRRMLYWEGEPVTGSGPSAGGRPADLEMGESV